MIYERIRNLREDKDLTQAEIAKYLNISQRAYSRYENDERGIPTEILIKLADYHNTSVDYLIGRTDIEKPYPPSSSSNKKKTNKRHNCDFIIFL